MAVFEYKTLKFIPQKKGFVSSSFEFDSELNRLGQNGWQVTTSFTNEISGTTTAVYYTLKRELQEK
ncbi:MULTISPECIES: DUF4177 domain-containing protein [Bacillus]|uniref:DUF4177 domain-containing protein n=2 Tax=Bacillus TaxID=1386 RepID=A0A0M5JL42_9BACI|nr:MULTISPECIES: DUF4177 domain-containing protein [Bacillus]ALC80651.1 hypothetical protein AM592_02910 [Bacillus gobiensis]MBP1079536.1 hypothetical protein [Bacillus capparidis]MED1094938.1 DUF4177 domain-containing protein [Bacillus capparidis]